jgi:hypothetical protein
MRGQRFELAPYIIHVLAEQWRNHGIRVDVTDCLTESMASNVLVIPHIDLTTIPRHYAEALSRCDRVLNRSVIDISKRTISRHLVASPDEYDGPVIVKTNRNFGGLPEARIARTGSGVGTSQFDLVQRLPWTRSGLLRPSQYPIFDHPRLVPSIVWRNPMLVVEKFLPERDGDLYCLRQYLFLGESEINVRSVSPVPIVKAGNVIRREIVSQGPPSEVREIRNRLGFDFGKFDYVVHAGEPIVFDVNRTPSYARDSKAGSASSLIVELARGIHAFLGRA